MTDRVVQFPNRFTLTQISGNTYDVAPAPGVVTAQGDDLSKANLLPDAVATSLGLTPANNPQIKDAIIALDKPLLYAKIRDIPDATATGIISIDVSDIVWDVYSEIRLIGNAWTSDSGMSLRLNNISTASYSQTLLKAGSAYANLSSQGALYQFEGTSTHPAYIDFSVLSGKHGPPSSRLSAVFHKFGRYDQMCMGISRLISAVTSFSTVNFCAYQPAEVVSIANLSLWGVKI